MRFVDLAGGHQAMVDDDDYELVNKFRWSVNVYPISTFRPFGQDQKVTLYMHKLIMGVPNAVMVDHIDRNPLNCCRSNLRIATRSQNQMNRGDGERGVHQTPSGRWRAQIQANEVYHNLGLFDTREEAIKARDDAATKLHGEFAILNRR